MKKVIIIFLSSICILLSWGIWQCFSKHESTKLLMNTIIGEKRFLEDSFNNLLSTDTILIDNINLTHGREVIKLSEIISFPCLVIHLPSIEEDICNSCIEYALNEVATNLKKISGNKHICIISVGLNPEIKERIYKKEYYITDKPLLNVPKANMPYYFVLDKDGHVEYLFAPNFSFKEHTDTYWRQLKQKYCLSDNPL